MTYLNFRRKWLLLQAELGTFEPLHDIQFFFAKSILLKHYETVIIKIFQKMSQGPPNPWLRSAKVQKEDFLEKPSRDLKDYFYFGNPSNAREGKLEVTSFFTI